LAVAYWVSVHSARYGVTALALAPGARAGDEEIAELISYLVSPAGEYFSGCLLELDSLLRTS